MSEQTTITAIRDLVDDDLHNLNELISNSLQSSIPSIELIGKHITQNQGKRLRPLVALLSAHACGYQGTSHITLAAIIELIHTATLLHDDVVDESTQRRGHTTANAKWGNPISVLVGDFLYSRSFQLMAQLNNSTVFSVLADTTNTIAAGEVLQLVHSNQTEINLETYFNIIHHKTAKLFESAAHLGGVLANAPQEHHLALTQFGCHFGMTYQIVDDLLDYLGENKRLGKNTGDDFREGKVTLPLIIAMNTDQDQQDWHDHINHNKPMDFAHALTKLHDCKAFAKTRQYAEQEAQKAATALANLPASSYKNALLDLLDLTLARDH